MSEPDQFSTVPDVFSAVPGDETPSLRAAYARWLEEQSPGRADQVQAPTNAGGLNVGIIGGGMAGLYAGLLLQEHVNSVRILEANPDRLGGRIYTHRFEEDEHTQQYVEAGAMRIPNIAPQKMLFDLVKYLNQRATKKGVKKKKKFEIELMPYVFYSKGGNRVLVNETKNKDGSIFSVDEAEKNPSILGFGDATKNDNGQAETAAGLLEDYLWDYTEKIKKDFDKGFEELIQYDNVSLYLYLHFGCRCPAEKINYLETMTSATNQFHYSFTECVIENTEFVGDGARKADPKMTEPWYTIKNGMDRLPEACKKLLEQNATIEKGQHVTKIEHKNDKVYVYCNGLEPPLEFDRIILALPPSAVRMIDTPKWSDPLKEAAIRSVHYQDLYKAAMQFTDRFWEKTTKPTGAKGGQSITDLPTRWTVYPSYDIDGTGKGVLLNYAWNDDAAKWATLPNAEDRKESALHYLQKLYPDVPNLRNRVVPGRFFDISWGATWAGGDAKFFPGQFRDLYNIARKPECDSSIFFAGEHLDVNHTWIVGALSSALYACRQLLGNKDLKPLMPKETAETFQPHSYDYSELVDTEPLPVDQALAAARTSQPANPDP